MFERLNLASLCSNICLSRENQVGNDVAENGVGDDSSCVGEDSSYVGEESSCVMM